MRLSCTIPGVQSSQHILCSWGWKCSNKGRMALRIYLQYGDMGSMDCGYTGFSSTVFHECADLEALGDINSERGLEYNSICAGFVSIRGRLAWCLHELHYRTRFDKVSHHDHGQEFNTYLACLHTVTLTGHNRGEYVVRRM